ncbi:protein maelstrom 1 [Colletes gigas]|uniref:protein maelstrom 1 n=1 Tax=Colletes gigas TaxID=935657 RepID=UPI001C9AB9ED|nr:protein maelstrom 1 [Colletes gigas]
MFKKNKGNNAFYFFMLDWKKDQEKAGRVFPNGLKDVSRDPQCSEEWQNISSQAKGYYNAKAKDSKIQSQVSMSKKNTIGQSIDEVMLAEKKEQEFQQHMFQYIDSLISIGTQHKNLDKLKFLFIHVNWFYKRDIGINKYDFCPAEFAVGSFSLKNGIEDIYHEIISVQIPLGWKRDAMETSAETHKININMPDGQSDFAYMYDKLVRVLESNMTGNKFPPLFTMKDLAPAVESLLNRMTEATNTSMDDFVIYSLEALFGALRNAVAQNVNDRSVPLVVAEHEFRTDFFLFTYGLGCPFHNNIEDASQYCSMSFIKRWCFTICDHCCQYLNIPLIEGVHCPKKKPDYNSTNSTSIDFQMKNLSINSDVVGVSMTGVSANYRTKVSERTYKEEQQRRNECKPLQLINHDTELPPRPLRLPNTTCKYADTDSSVDLDDFPPLGGATIEQKCKINHKHLLGKGRGKC